MNRSVWLSALVLLTVLGSGCQTAKLPTPKWPEFAMFKKKDKDLAPPSEHFDVPDTQIAAGAPGDRKLNEIPGEAPASAVTSPSQLARPTAPIASAKASSPNANAKEKDTPGALSAGNSPQPIRKPYELAKSATDSLEQAAGATAAKLNQSAQSTTEQLNRNANEVVGKFQQQGRALTDSANSAVKQASGTLNQAADNAFGAAGTNGKSLANSDPAAAGNAFAFSRPTGPAPAANAAPPWSSGNTGTAPAAGALSAAPPIQPSKSVDPLQTLAAPAALNPIAANASPPGAAPAPSSGERQMQPIKSPLANQNNPLNNSAEPNQFRLPVAQPPAFVANRSTSPPAERGGSSQAGNLASAMPINNAPAMTATSPGISPAAAPARSATTGGERYPATGFNSFAASRNEPVQSNGPAKLAADAGSASLQPMGTARINSDWQNPPAPVANVSQPTQPSSNQPVSHTAELPAELLQRSGSYAPGSVGGGSSNATLWR